MKPSICLYCPDSHITYNRSTLDEKGIGGGVTVRVRMAHALAARGHQVKLYGNCPEERFDRGVEYIHHSKLTSTDADVFIASTSGGSQDLSPLARVHFGDSIKIILVHGLTKPLGLEGFPVDFFYVPSNFIRRWVSSQWNIPTKRIFVSHHGIEEVNFKHRKILAGARDPYSIIYASHPSKGLDTAIAIYKQIKQVDSRFSLQVYGGYGLWGEERVLSVDSDVHYHGLVGQPVLSHAMQKSGFSLCLQDREEPFGLSAIESMRAGCIVLASQVGAYPEIITTGVDGYLIAGNHSDKKTRQSVVNLILELVRNKDQSALIRKNASLSPLTWDKVAESWEGHWDTFQVIERKPPSGALKTHRSCPDCGGKNWLILADGIHCVKCGNYLKHSNQIL